MSLADLGRRSVACKHWRWMPGMMLQWKTENGSQYRGRVCDTWSFEDEGTLYCEGHEDRFTREKLQAAWPDLDDPATIGCLLQLVREAWGKPDLYARPEGSRWRMWSFEWPSSMLHPTEAEALVAALEAAP